MTKLFSDLPLVSIVLPTYNRDHLLAYAIQNILKQTYENLELIIIDDNSSDNTPSIVRSINDERVRYFRNATNLKLPSSLNKGFSLARGEYLTWTSDDNLFHEKAIERMVDVISSTSCDFVYADYYLFSELNEKGKPTDAQLNQFPNELQLEKGNHIGACFLYTRQVYREIGDYETELFLVEDYDYFIRISKQFTMHHIAEPLYYFRRDDNTLYCSRYCEVKASDFLVRFKNGLLNENEIIDTILSLVLDNIENINNPIFRLGYRAFHNTSYRLTRIHRSLLSLWIKKRLKSEIVPILSLYRSGNITFKDARNQIKDCLQRLANIEYRN